MTIAQTIEEMTNPTKQRFERFACCLYCHVPQAFCKRWRPEVFGTGQLRWRPAANRRCQWRGVVIPAFVSALYVRKQWVLELMYYMNRRAWFENESQLYRWLGKKVEYGGVEGSRLGEVFYHIACSVEQEKGSW